MNCKHDVSTFVACPDCTEEPVTERDAALDKLRVCEETNTVLEGLAGKANELQVERAAGVARVAELEKRLGEAGLRIEAVRVSKDARIAQLEAALWKYGRHDTTCNVNVNYTDDGASCTCGLDAALTPPEATGKETP